MQLISFLLARREEIRQAGPALVVCPSSLVYNWEAEFKKFAPKLQVCVVAGTPQERMDLLSGDRGDVLITSYDLLRRDLAGYEGKQLWCVALDEAQYIKTPLRSPRRRQSGSWQHIALRLRGRLWKTAFRSFGASLTF